MPGNRGPRGDLKALSTGSYKNKTNREVLHREEEGIMRDPRYGELQFSPDRDALRGPYYWARYRFLVGPA